jgi:hypothetical protein
VFFSSKCPLLNGGLSIGHRLLYTGACWCYITNTFAVPLAIMVPFLAIVFGILPFNLNRWAAQLRPLQSPGCGHPLQDGPPGALPCTAPHRTAPRFLPIH